MAALAPPTFHIKISPATPRRFSRWSLGAEGTSSLATTVRTSIPSSFASLHGHLDVHVVAGIVAVEAGHPLAAVCGLEGVEKHLRRRRREDLAHGHGINHVPADVADEGRFMARAAPRYDSHLAGYGSPPKLQDTWIVRRGNQIRMGLEVAFNHFIYRRLRRIDHLLHGRTSLILPSK